MADRVLVRFMRLVKVDSDSGCWLWQGFVDRDGYGKFKPSREKCARAHRWAYERFVGSLVDGQVVDHLCRTRRCCNPSHLEQVSNKENLVRSAALVTHCPAGHRYTERDNRGKRMCRPCRRAAARRHYRKVTNRG